MKYVVYLRVSTKKQGEAGLGMGAQKAAVERYIIGGEVIREFIEVESGRKSDRKELREALGCCREHGATLVIAKLDRLSRDVTFIDQLQKNKVRFVACDIPGATEEMIGFMAVLAQGEAKRIRQRIVDALAVAKERGKVLGNPKLIVGSEYTKERSAEGSAASAKVRRDNPRFSDAVARTARLLARDKTYSEVSRELFEMNIRKNDNLLSAVDIHRLVRRGS